MLLEINYRYVGHAFQSKWETLPHAVDDIARGRPSHVALKDGLGNVLTYEQLSRNVYQIARTISESEVGDSTTTRVAVFQLPSVFWISSMLAIMKSGAAYIPLDLRSGMPRLGVILKESNASVVLVDSNKADRVPDLQADTCTRILNIDHIVRVQAAGDTPDNSRPDSTGVILYTSGSTGTPKGVALSHRSLMNQMASCILKWEFNDEVVLQQSSYTFDFSLFQIYLALLTGGRCYVVSSGDRGDGRAIADIISKEQITVTGGVPSECREWLRRDDHEAMGCSDYATMVCGGEPFEKGLVEALQALRKKNLRAINIYVPTEVTIASNATEVHYNDDKLSSCSSKSVGRPLPNYSVYILDHNLEPVPAGVSGQIAISGPLSQGYIDEGGPSNGKFLPDPNALPENKDRGWGFMHLSGDQGRLRPSDETLLCEGRIEGDTQIKLRGMRIDLRDIESVILSRSNGIISDAVVSVRGDPIKFLVARVTLCPRHGIPSAEERNNYLGRLMKDLPLPQHMIPAIAVPLDTLPVTVSGKIDRRAIGMLPLPTIQQVPARTTEAGATEDFLRAVWYAVIGSDSPSAAHSLGPELDFFQVGGNSLLLLNLQDRIQAAFGVKVPLVQPFGAPSLAGMTATINRALGKDDDVAAGTNIVDWDYETSAAEYHGYYRGNTELVRDLGRIPDKMRPLTPAKRTVILTGTTGFVGRRLLSALLASPDGGQIHCLAVRSPDLLRSVSLSDPRVAVYPGYLGSPRLGLTVETADSIFQEADIIIHNGAEVSFLKSYQSLRRNNVGSTKELVRMSLTNYRRSSKAFQTFHFVSTVGIAQLHGDIPSFGPVPASSIPPPTDGSDGYASMKWASERFLEHLLT